MKSVPINDTSRVFAAYQEEFEEAVCSALRSGRWLSGPRVQAFAEEFAGYIGVPYCLPVANGTDALELAMRSIVQARHPEGREVITVANAGGYAVTACCLVGLQPVFADVAEDSQLVDIQSVVSELTDQTAIVVATHLYGGVVDIEALRRAIDFAGYSHVPIIEDCAQAHGARLRGRMVGSLGDISTFSFYPTKNLGAMGDAGAVTTADAQLYEYVRHLHQYGWSEKYRVSYAGGRNSRMDEVQAAVLSVGLRNLDFLNECRRRVLASYSAVASEHLRFISFPNGTVAHLAVCLCQDRDALRAHMGERNIDTAIHYPILDCDQPAWRSFSSRSKDALLVSRRSVPRLATLPCFPFMTEGEVEIVLSALEAWRPTSKCINASR